MLDIAEVDRVVDKAASAALRKARVSRVYSSPTLDSDGQEALNVTIVLRRGSRKTVSGEAALSAIVRIGRDLWKNGEERFPIIEFVTEEELDASGDPES